MPVLNFKITGSTFEEKQELEHLINYFKDHRRKIDEILNVFFLLAGVRKTAITKITINLKSSQKEECEGWTMSDDSIAIKYSAKHSLSEVCLLIIPHEIFHLIIWKNKTLTLKMDRLAEDNSEKLKKINFENWEIHMILEELLISSFIPEGYLAEKFLGTDVQKKAQKEIMKNHRECFLCERYKSAYKLYPFAKKYVENKKKIDSRYLKAIIENFPWKDAS
jgi:hypothetical protein